ncbi:MAG TPA: LCP family protein [Patescibacteria group bacterium]|nr:LCP family protein [Patescibacteria group bacterium]
MIFMKFFWKKSQETSAVVASTSQKKSRRWWKIALVIFVICIGVGVWKAGFILNKISTKGNIFENIARSIPGVKNTVDGEEEGRINIALLAMRGNNIPGGGLLADTIMVVSIKPTEKKASIISVPRDLYVTVPGTETKEKINAFHFYGEEKGEGKGLEAMKQILSDVSGIPIHYAVSINFEGFKKLIDAIGGIDITLAESFIEPVQFHEKHVCDPVVFTIPANDYEVKIDYRGKVVAQYPLCYNPNEECGGVFELPAGPNHLDGENALCYVRARSTSSDFERARRQQEILKLTQQKLLSVGTLADFGKLNALMDVAGDNVRTDMQLWEMQRFFELYQQIGTPTMTQKVLENSEDGLLYVPEGAGQNGTAYILLPRGDTYDRIHELFRTIL